MDNCTILVDDIVGSADNLRTYLKQECKLLLQDGGLSEGIESALPYGSDEERVDIILDIIEKIAETE